jgi:hypothetical protein
MASETIKDLWKARGQRRSLRKQAVYQQVLQENPDRREQILKGIEKVSAFQYAPPKNGRPGRDGVTPSDAHLVALITPIIKKLLPSKEQIMDMIYACMPTDAQLKDLIQPLIPEAKRGQDGRSISTTAIAEMVEAAAARYASQSALSPDAIAQAAIPLIEQKMNEARKGWFGGGGGGDLVRAGSGIAITTNNIGAKVISASGGVAWSTPTGTVNGTNTVFTVASEPTEVLSDGTIFVDGAGYSYAALTITLTNPPASFIRYR